MGTNMGINYTQPLKSQGCQPAPCLDKFGCPDNRCPDFFIRRHDTKPPFKVAVEDCDGPMDIQGLVIEVNMWAMGKLKKTLATTDTNFVLADGVGLIRSWLATSSYWIEQDYQSTCLLPDSMKIAR